MRQRPPTQAAAELLPVCAASRGDARRPRSTPVVQSLRTPSPPPAPRQGRFKRPLSVDDVVCGQEYSRPYKNLRGCWLMEKVGGRGGRLLREWIRTRGAPGLRSD